MPPLHHKRVDGEPAASGARRLPATRPSLVSDELRKGTIMPAVIGIVPADLPVEIAIVVVFLAGVEISNKIGDKLSEMRAERFYARTREGPS